MPKSFSPLLPRAEPTLILWDLVGSCNLKCPSCPMGNMRAASNKGFITDELFEAILSKLQRDFAKCRQLHFYNWTEPLLHPRIVEHCRAAAAAGFHVHLSSNLNHLKDAQGLLSSGIKTLRISLSGFSQAVYEIGHRGGQIEKVKANMRRLAEARRALAGGSRTRMHVYFHRYRHNLDDIAPMEAFARELGFEFFSDWAFLMPLETLLAHEDGALPEDDRAFAAARIVPPVAQSLRLMREMGAAREPCELIEQLVLDHRGRAMLCCATFDQASNVVGDYLNADWPELQRRRYASAVCPRCTACGAHALYTSPGHAERRARLDTLAQQAMLQPAPAQVARQSIALPILSEAHPILARSA